MRKNTNYALVFFIFYPRDIVARKKFDKKEDCPVNFQNTGDLSNGLGAKFGPEKRSPNNNSEGLTYGSLNFVYQKLGQEPQVK
ncbi:hypothetical protein TNCV_4536041 [Trichonephila clavipes]|nr:hypothetical protein TNCV_4536041 [Trichonephila clavipes]